MQWSGRLPLVRIECQRGDVCVVTEWEHGVLFTLSTGAHTD